MRPTLTSNYYYIFSIHDGSSRHGVEMYHDYRYSPVNSHLSTSYNPGGATWPQTYPTNSFTDVKFEKTSSGVSLSINGVVKGTIASGVYNPAAMQVVKVASYGGAGVHFNGIIKNLRIYEI